LPIIVYRLTLTRLAYSDLDIISKVIAMKRSLFFIVFLLFLTSCATIQDLERKKNEGDFTVEFYNYGWEQVYGAIKFVFRHSEDSLLSSIYRECNIDYAHEEKTIWIKILLGPVYMGIYFEPQDESKTKVIFVKGGTPALGISGIRIKRLNNETHFLLDNGEEAYRKYTHEEYLKRWGTILQ
jgi:hypothetical protein